MIEIVRSPRLCLGFLSVLLLLCIGAGLVSAALADDAEDPGYYDGDGDDAVVAPERLAVLLDLAVCARSPITPLRTPEALEPPPERITPPTVDRSQPPLPRSPPLA